MPADISFHLPEQASGKRKRLQENEINHHLRPVKEVADGRQGYLQDLLLGITRCSPADQGKGNAFTAMFSGKPQAVLIAAPDLGRLPASSALPHRACRVYDIFYTKRKGGCNLRLSLLYPSDFPFPGRKTACPSPLIGGAVRAL
jgi:hypothetical protein